MTSTPRRPDEQLIGALIPRPLDRELPAPAPSPTLPAQRKPGHAGLRLDTAYVDSSGRIGVQALLQTLSWNAGHPLAFDVADRTVIVTSSHVRGHVVGARGTLALPMAIRRMTGIDCGATVIVAVNLATRTMFIHPEAVVAMLLADLHTRIEGGRHGR
jgi:hypothetical protein